MMACAQCILRTMKRQCEWSSISEGVNDGIWRECSWSDATGLIGHYVNVTFILSVKGRHWKLSRSVCGLPVMGLTVSP
jgi:hypothetical protein